MQPNIVIESLGVYLPPNVVSTREVLDGCKYHPMLPLERITGIESRRVAGTGEFSIDLAKKAIEACIASSKYVAEDVDLLVCCNISRCDGPQYRFSLEPSTSVRLREYFGFDSALAFDITNACAGTFTAISIIEAFIKAGVARCGMVVSGEYITCLTQTAQREVRGLRDPRLACLTLGDSGCAMILEGSREDTVGLQAIDMYTLGRYSSYCIARVTEQEPSGPIMLTDSIRLSTLAIEEGVKHGLQVIEEQGWSPEAIKHFIMHQTSRRSLRDAIHEANRIFGRRLWHDGNVIDDLATRGNTATNSHFVAVMDNIRNDRIKSGDTALFSIGASGLTIGTALYTFDDLPDRLGRIASGREHPSKVRLPRNTSPALPLGADRVRILSVGTSLPGSDAERDAIALATQAGLRSLSQAQCRPSDIELLIYAGVYRNDFLFEPALGAIIAGKLESDDPHARGKIFAFDVFNSALGFLVACYAATHMMRTRDWKRAMILASEIENNAGSFPEMLRGITETGSAIILDRMQHGQSGFGNFVFHYSTEYIGAVEAYAHVEMGHALLRFLVQPGIEDYYVSCISAAIRELLEIEDIAIEHIRLIFPPQMTPTLITKLACTLSVDQSRFVNLTGIGSDLFTSSLPYTLQHAYEHDLVRPGDIGLFIGIGAGVQVGCATYYF